MKHKRKKVPVIMQMEALECGAASLCMILAHYGKWLPLPRVRTELGVSRDGVSAKSILRGARSFGMEGKGFRYGVDALKEKIALPCILFWDNCHFVVLTGFGKKGAYINDPASGAVVVPMDKFEKHYSGVALEIVPGAGFVPSGRPTSIWPFVKKRLTGAGGALAFLSLSGLAAAVFGIAQPALSSSFVDKILTGANTAWLMPLLLILTGLAVIQFFLQAATASYRNYVQGRFAVSANCDYLMHVLRLPMQFFSQRMAGDIAGRQRDNAAVANTLLNTFAPMGVGLITMAVYLIMMLSISPVLTLIGVTALLIDLFAAQVISRRRMAAARVIARDSGMLSGSTASILGMMETIKASGAEDGVYARWTGMQAAMVSGQAKIARLNTYWGGIPQLLLNVSNVLLVALGALLIIRGKLTTGMLLALQSLLQSLITPAEQLIAAGQEITEMRSSMERIEDVTNYETDEVFSGEHAPDKDTSSITGAVSIRNVTFGYSRQATPVIRDFSLELTPGRKVALVGSSGCGKSTISKLVAGLYQPWEGEILFDGKPMAAYDRAAFTSSVAVVDQDIFLFSGTVKDNFRFSDGTISDSDMIRAARDAQVHEAILKHPGGYDAFIAEGGANFSGGQRQQLEIARALAGNPSVLILDEGTSALDAQTEALVMDAIKARGMTMLLIAHRLSTIRDADEILVLKDGVVIERGTHEQLLALGGEYASLVSAA
ncbi:MAG: NHLP family bacteriocin export ABC transporter peptidase/permease/ATPase subunit [Clostridia bacterium]|nr:NHLP family bacteriocin export ABC transporter peptidase/permease/ATPase subunit [Clostridia bacterium]